MDTEYEIGPVKRLTCPNLWQARVRNKLQLVHRRHDIPYIGLATVLTLIGS